MLHRIRDLLQSERFEPFAIRTSDGREYVIATRDHAHVRPDDSRLYVYLDRGSDVAISALHLASIVERVVV